MFSKRASNVVSVKVWVKTIVCDVFFPLQTRVGVTADILTSCARDHIYQNGVIEVSQGP